jgi:single-stranded DNA-binding protein
LQIAVFGDKANSLALAKGDRCYVEGRLKLESWQGKDGQERQGLKVSAWRVERLGEIGKNKPAAARDDMKAGPLIAFRPHCVCK